MSAEPRVSVVICTHNRADWLRGAIDSVLGQGVPDAEYELLVVDNRSTDGTRALCESYAGHPSFRFVYEPELGLCHARNRGWREARGEHVAYLDDDAVAEPGWLTAIGQAFASEPRAGVVGGKVEPIWEVPQPHWLSDHLAWGLTIVDWPGGPKVIPDVRVEWLVGANMAMPRRVLEDVGGFEPRLDRVGSNMLSGGDVFLQRRIIERGYLCVYEPAMAVRHLVPKARLERDWFARRYYWQGVSDAVMELITDNPSGLGRLWRGMARAWRLLGDRRLVRDLLDRENDDPSRFEQHCWALIALGHTVGLLGAARR